MENLWRICFALCCLIKGIVRLKVKSSLFVSSVVYMDDFIVPIELIKLFVILLHRYKERLETKYLKPRKLRGNSETLIGTSWTFLEKGSDDFRDGLPPEANYNYVKKVRLSA